MTITKFIEEIGEKVLPARNVGPDAIRRHLTTRLTFLVPSDFVVLYNEDDAIVILGGTVRDERAREAIVQAAGNIQGVERVDDRMTAARATREAFSR